MRMLGKQTLLDRGKNFWYCCPGHDHYDRMYVKVHKKTQRQKEKRLWKKGLDGFD